jgi:hypothetical protein
MNKDILKINNIELLYPGDVQIDFNLNHHQILIVDNKTIQHKVLLFRDNKLIITLDVENTHPLMAKYKHNELIDVENIELRRKND